MSTTTETAPILLSAREAARLLNVSERTLFSWRATEGLPHVRIGSRCVRYPAEGLRRWAESRTEAGAR